MTFIAAQGVEKPRSYINRQRCDQYWFSISMSLSAITVFSAETLLVVAFSFCHRSCRWNM